MATLREIEEDIQALEALLYEVGGDVTEEEAQAAVDEWLRENEERLSQKLDGYAGLITSLAQSAKVRKEEAARLASLAKADEGVVARLKDRLLYFLTNRLDGQGPRKVKTKYHEIAVVKNGGVQSLEIDGNAEEFPHSIWTKKVVVWDTDAIRDWLEAGNTLAFARLKDRGEHLRVR